MIHEIVVNDWTKESINELSNNQIYCTSLVYDQFDTPHVFYITTNNELKRSFRTPIGWFEDIVDTRVVGRYVSAKIDSNGMIHVAYVKDGLMCISGDQTGWQKSELVDPNLNVIKNSFVSLDIDSNDMPHIAYYDGVKKDLLYARKTMNNIWEVSTIDSVGDVGKYCSIHIMMRQIKI